MKKAFFPPPWFAWRQSWEGQPQATTRGRGGGVEKGPWPSNFPLYSERKHRRSPCAPSQAPTTAPPHALGTGRPSLRAGTRALVGGCGPAKIQRGFRNFLGGGPSQQRSPVPPPPFPPPFRKSETTMWVRVHVHPPINPLDPPSLWTLFPHPQGDCPWAGANTTALCCNGPIRKVAPPRTALGRRRGHRGTRVVR